MHLLDTAIRPGETGGPVPLPDLPMTPGREVAGTVRRAGPGVDPSWVGKPVVAHLGTTSGGYAAMAVARAESLHGIPAGLSPEVAVAAIGTGRTALGILGRAGLEMLDVGGRIVMFGWSAGEPMRFTTADVAKGSLSIQWITGPRMLRRYGGLRGLETAALAEARPPAGGRRSCSRSRSPPPRTRTRRSSRGRRRGRSC